MRALALLAGLCLLTVILPAPAEAHVDDCAVDDLQCILQCVRGHVSTPAPHQCRLYWTGALP